MTIQTDDRPRKAEPAGDQAELDDLHEINNDAATVAARVSEVQILIDAAVSAGVSSDDSDLQYMREDAHPSAEAFGPEIWGEFVEEVRRSLDELARRAAAMAASRRAGNMCRQVPRRDERCRLYVDDRQAVDVAAEVLAHLARRTGARVVVHGGGLAVIDADHEKPVRPLTSASLTYELGHRVEILTTLAKGGSRACALPKAVEAAGLTPNLDVARERLNLQGMYDWALPERVEQVAAAPFMRADGSIFDASWVDESTGTLYVPASGLGPVQAPDAPTREDARRSAQSLDREVFGGFPFASQADRANALAYLLTPPIRSMGLAPLFAVNASVMGAGKSLLTDVVARTWTGRPVVSISLGPEEELRKSITAAFMYGAEVVRFDEVDRLQGRALQKMLTEDVYSDRVLGVSRIGSWRNNVTWAATGNNFTIGGDMPRRIVSIRLTPAEEDPSQRHHDRDLATWILAERATAIRHALTILRAWFVAGQPAPEGGHVTFGSYQRWATVIGGALAWAGVDGFMGNRETIARSDDSAETTTVLAALAATFPDRFIALDAVDAATVTPEQVETWVKRGMSAREAWGRWLSKWRERWFGDLRIVRDGQDHNHRQYWRLETRQEVGSA